MFIPAFVQQQASWLLRAARPLALVLLAVVFAHAHPRIPATRYRCRRADTCGHTASLCCTFENRRGHGHDRPLRSARLSPAAIGTVAPGGPKFGPSFSVRRVTVPKTHFLYAVVQYTQVRTSTAVSSQSTSGEPRNLAASPQPARSLASLAKKDAADADFAARGGSRLAVAPTLTPRRQRRVCPQCASRAPSSSPSSSRNSP